MTLFTTFAFPSTGGATSRTLPDRLAEVKNVRDFGATGDGTTDDLSSIMAALSAGTIVYFPPGTYYVSAPIDFSAPDDTHSGPFVTFAGEMGLSTVVGNFAEYVFKRGIASTPRWSGGDNIERLTIVNRHAGGGGIRLGASQGAFIRDCDITADIGIDDDNTSTLIDSGNVNGSFEVVITNCGLRPYNTLATGSVGINKTSSGPVTNCTIIGFDVGMGTSSGQGAAAVQGCYFEHNNIGLSPGRSIEAWGNGAGNQASVSGCYFKNNGYGVAIGASHCTFSGLRIEAATGSITGNPVAGIYVFGDSGKTTMCRGVSITGDYSLAGVYIVGGESTRHLMSFDAVSSVNNLYTTTPGDLNWHLPVSAHTTRFKACNVATVYTMAKLPAATGSVTSGTWSSGTATLNFSTSPIDVSNLAGKACRLTVTGVTPSGYNGTFTGTMVSGTQLTFAVSNPGGSASAGGSVFLQGSENFFLDNVYEGETYNVSDANSATWGAAVTAGGGSNHVKLRYTPAAWTVVGK